MTCRKKFYQWIVLKLIRLKSIITLIPESSFFVISNICRFGTDNDLILKVAPLRDTKVEAHRNYFPLPGYGVPPGKKKKYEDEQHNKYGLFLWPDRLYKDVWKYVFLILCTLIPFITLKIKSADQYTWSIMVACIFLIIIAFAMLVIFILYARTSPPVLSDIWQMWPESQYSRFLNVPHLSELTKSDDGKKGEQFWHRYWCPDTQTSLQHQPSYYRVDKNTLQEVILHLSMFNFLFVKCDAADIKKEEAEKPLSQSSVGTFLGILDYKSSSLYRGLERRNWYYLFSPAVISYFLLIISLFISTYFYPDNLDAQPAPILQIPYFYIVLIVIWSVMTLRMVLRQIDFLEKLQKDVRDGYYDSHLSLVPQQILKVISQIPDDTQISEGIKQVTKVLQYVQAGALLTFLAMLEIFSQAYGQQGAG